MVWRGWMTSSVRATVRDVQVLHDPELEAKISDVVGLYLNPPQKAIVLCVDEKSQIQALHHDVARGMGGRHRQSHRPMRKGNTDARH